jgi:hypothetical protein
MPFGVMTPLRNRNAIWIDTESNIRDGVAHRTNTSDQYDVSYIQASAGDSYNESDVRMHGRLTVFSQDVGSTDYIYYYDMFDDSTFSLPNTLNETAFPDVWGGTIVFQARDNAASTWRIYYLNIGDPSPTLVGSGATHQLCPRISDNYIVWYSSGFAGPPTLRTYDLDRGIYTTIYTWNAGQDFQPCAYDVWDGTVVYVEHDFGSSNFLLGRTIHNNSVLFNLGGSGGHRPNAYSNLSFEAGRVAFKDLYYGNGSAEEISLYDVERSTVYSVTNDGGAGPMKGQPRLDVTGQTVIWSEQTTPQPTLYLQDRMTTSSRTWSGTSTAAAIGRPRTAGRNGLANRRCPRPSPMPSIHRSRTFRIGRRRGAAPSRSMTSSPRANPIWSSTNRAPEPTDRPPRP